MPCSAEACHGSILIPPPEKRLDAMRSKEDMLVHSKNFIEQYFASIKRFPTPRISLHYVGLIVIIAVLEPY